MSVFQCYLFRFEKYSLDSKTFFLSFQAGMKLAEPCKIIICANKEAYMDPWITFV